MAISWYICNQNFVDGYNISKGFFVQSVGQSSWEYHINLHHDMARYPYTRSYQYIMGPILLFTFTYNGFRVLGFRVYIHIYYIHIVSIPIGSMYTIYGNIYHQYTPVMLAYIYIYHTWILWDIYIYIYWALCYENNICLVVGPPLWKRWKSIGMMRFPNIWENKIDGNQTTNQLVDFSQTH